MDSLSWCAACLRRNARWRPGRFLCERCERRFHRTLYTMRFGYGVPLRDIVYIYRPALLERHCSRPARFLAGIESEAIGRRLDSLPARDDPRPWLISVPRRPDDDLRAVEVWEAHAWLADVPQPRMCLTWEPDSQPTYSLTNLDLEQQEGMATRRRLHAYLADILLPRKASGPRPGTHHGFTHEEIDLIAPVLIGLLGQKLDWSDVQGQLAGRAKHANDAFARAAVRHPKTLKRMLKNYRRRLTLS
jgi:hypothetical protein